MPAQSVLPVPLEADSLGAQLLEQGADWLDDATAAVAETVRNVMRRLADVNERMGVGLIVVEQNVPFAFSMADGYAVLKIGEIADDGLAGDEHAAVRVQEQLQL